MSRAPGFTEYIEFQHSEDLDDETDSPLLSYTNSRSTGLEEGPRPRASIRKIFNDLWAPAPVESARVNHHFSNEEKRKLNQYESIDYLPPNSAAFRKWLASQPHRRYWDRWVMMGAIGMATGLVAYLLYVAINLLAEFKYGVTRWLIAHTNMGVAWLFNCSFSLVLVTASSALVVGLAPAAVGSGVPEVMAYLNGVLMPRVFNVYTMMVKFASCALAVASGLPVGPEGPMIHIGAALGAAISQGHSTTLQFTTGVFKRFRNPKDKRDFVTAGVAVGVATAFNAPIGGLLFAFEEVASFWQVSLGWQIFFACMCAVMTLNLGRSAGLAVLHSGFFGWFTQDVVFEAGVEISAHILAVVPAAVIGLLCGVVGVVFTVLNLRVSRVRDVIMRGRKWSRMIEPCMLVVLYTTGSMLLPMAFPCSATQCVNFEGKIYCDLDNTTAWIDSKTPPPSSPLAMPMYTCSNDASHNGSAWIPGSGTLTPDTSTPNTTTTVYYNGLATLLLNTGDDGIKHLLARGTHRRFNYSTLLTLLAWYFMGAAFTSGSAISSGLFVPMLMMGACLGRLVGLATTDIAAKWGQHLTGIIATNRDPWSWIDPGAFALVGASAFMGGVTRLTIALAVIAVEISDDVHLLLPVLVGIMVAKWVADAATHPLYHALLEVKCVPFLLPEPVSRYSLDLVQISAIMRRPVVCLSARMKVRGIQAVLRDTTHNGFPVVVESSVGEIFTGIISRAHLLAVLQDAAAQEGASGSSSSSHSRGGTMVNGSSSNVTGDGSVGRRQSLLRRQLSWTALNRKIMDPVESQRGRTEQQMVEVQESTSCDLDMLTAGMLDEEIDLGSYVNTSAVAVQETFSVERAYILFRNMGLRHLVVVDELNRVKGIVTRKDLLGFKLDDALAKAIRKVDSVTNLGQQEWIPQSQVMSRAQSLIGLSPLGMEGVVMPPGVNNA